MDKQFVSKEVIRLDWKENDENEIHNFSANIGTHNSIKYY